MPGTILQVKGSGSSSSSSSTWPGDFGLHRIYTTLPPKDEPHSHGLLIRQLCQLLVVLGELAA